MAVQGTQKDKAVAVNFSVQTPNGPFAIVMNGNQDGDAISRDDGFRRSGPGGVDREAAGRRRRPRGGPSAGGEPPAQADKPSTSPASGRFQIEIGGGTPARRR